MFAYAGVKVLMNEADVADIQAEIAGPVGTPYEGGVYRCKLTVEHDFPNNPPKGTRNATQATSSPRSSTPTSRRRARSA